MKRPLTHVIFLILAAWQTLACGQSTEDWQPLFNGRNLDGWVLVNTPPETWTFENGLLICSGKPIGEIRTQRMYQNFEMEIEWRHMKPGGNAGIFVWADDITARGVPFHRGIEVQVLENAYGNTQNYSTHGDIFPIHGADMTPINGRGGKRAFPTEHRALPSPQWNHYRIVCDNGMISLAVNGSVVTRGENASPRKGYLCLESEGGIVHFRNGRIRELPATPIDDRHIAKAARGFRSLYSGLDLRGWDTTQAGGASWQSKDWVLHFDGQTAAPQSALTSQAELQLQGFVFDFRFSERSERLEVQLPGAAKPLVFTTSGESPYAVLLEPSGKWNRVEGVVRPSEVQLLVNDSPIQVDLQVQPGRLVFTPTGAVDLSNIYIR